MRSFLLCFVAVALFACVEYTGPRQFCALKGDTTGLAPLYQAKDSVVVACLFTVEPRDVCYGKPVRLWTRADCTEGTKWPGPY